MRKFAVFGLVGTALASGTVSVSYGAEEVLFSTPLIESASDVGYATSSTRRMAIELFAKEAMNVPTASAVATESPVAAATTEIVPVQAEEPMLQLAAVTMVVPTPRPDFESVKSLTTDVAPPAKRVAQKIEPKVVKVSDRLEKKRITTVPLPVSIGVFR